MDGPAHLGAERDAGRLRPVAERLDPVPRADVRRLYLPEPVAGRAAGFRCGHRSLPDAAELAHRLRRVRDGAAENRRARPLPGAGELEAGAGELSRVLSLRAGAPVAGDGASLLGRHDARRAASPAGQAARAVHPAQARQRAGQAGMGGAGLGGGILNVGFATGSLDGKPVAPLLPTKKEYTHRQRVASTAWALGCIQCYDDYVAVVQTYAARRHGDRCGNLLAGERGRERGPGL